MNDHASVEIYGTISDNIEIYLNSSEELYGLMKIEIRKNAWNCNNREILSVFLCSKDLLSEFIPLLKKGKEVMIIGDLEPIQKAKNTSIKHNNEAYCDYEIKVCDPKRIKILQNESVYRNIERKSCKINIPTNYKVAIRRLYSDVGIENII